MKIKLNDLRKGYISCQNQIRKNIFQIINRSDYILGKETKILENKLSNYLRCKYSISVGSGTDALLIALMALNIKQGDEIIIPAMTWISTGEVIKILGAKIKFVDVKLEDGVINEELIEKKVTKKTKGIISVSLYGNNPNFDKLKKIALKYKLFLIDDAAQSLGTRYNNKNSTDYCLISCTSFFPGKILGGFGDGGAIFTNKKSVYNKCRLIRNHGQSHKSYSKILGLNGRLDTIQAGIIIPKLKRLNKEISQRKKIWKKYYEYLNKKIHIIKPLKKCKSNYFAFAALFSKRDSIQKYLSLKGIQTQINYRYSLPSQKTFYEKNHKKKYPNSTLISNQVLNLPIHSFITNKEMDFILKNLTIALKKYE